MQNGGLFCHLIKKFYQVANVNKTHGLISQFINFHYQICLDTINEKLILAIHEMLGVCLLWELQP